MEFGRGGRGRKLPEAAYSPSQVESVLRGCGVEVVGETVNDFLAFCPYHGNRDTPALSVSRMHGTFICFNHACGMTGSLLELVKDTTKRNDFEALRFIGKMKNESPVSYEQQLERALAPVEDFKLFPQDTLDRLYEQMWGDDSRGRDYMKTRGFEEETLREYKIGFSAKQNMIATPMHDVFGKPVGLIGRSANPHDKSFKNSVGLPTSKTLWNIHRAKRTGDTVIICEANFDAMRISQAGFPNVVACLGGNFSPYHVEQLDKYFNNIIIMTDFDDKERHVYAGCRKCAKVGRTTCIGHNPGRALGETIAEKMIRKRISWASYEDRVVYPPGVKDAGDMTDEQIVQSIKNAVPNYIYHTWNIER